MKRGWFDGIGSVFKVVFGTLDQDDALRYNKAINSINDDEKNTIRLLKEQTIVVKSTIENFNNTLTNLNKNEEIFNKNLKIMEDYTKTSEKVLFDIQL